MIKHAEEVPPIGTEELLQAAAVFVDRDQDAPGFLERFARFAAVDPRTASQALDQALAARERAGDVRLALEAGDLRVMTTSSGATLTACALATPSGDLAASICILDNEHRPVAGAAIGMSTADEEHVVVTDEGGRTLINAEGVTLFIRLGGDAAVRDGLDRCTAVIPLPREVRDVAQEQLELAAAHEGDVAQDAYELDRWRIRAGGVDFLCLERSGGYDLTALVTGVSAEFVGAAAGACAVSFVTHGHEGRPQRWIVPLAPTVLGLAGSLYGTDEYHLDESSILVGNVGQLIGTLTEQAEEVIARSVKHADVGTAWQALSRRLDAGPLRDFVNAALAEREAIR